MLTGSHRVNGYGLMATEPMENTEKKISRE